MILGQYDEEFGMHREDERKEIKDPRDVRAAGGTSLENMKEVQAAKKHEESRLKAIAEMFCILGLLAREQVLDEEAFFTHAGAKEQDGMGSDDRGTQAAHCLPGHLMVDRLRLDDYLRQPPGEKGEGIHETCEEFLRSCHFLPEELCSAVKELFGRTEIAVTALNQADSHVELFSQKEFGLKETFAICAGTVVSGLEHGGLKNADWKKVLLIVTQCWRTYCTMATRKIAAALERKKGELASPKTSVTKIKLRIRILTCYHDTVKNAKLPYVLSSPGFEEFRKAIMDS
jgi:hypothetical protein